MCVQLREYKVVGRGLPSSKVRTPTLYQMRIFAPDQATAKSRFWYFLSQLRKLKKATGEIVSCSRVGSAVYAMGTVYSMRSLCVCMYVGVRACMCVRACMYVCVCVCVYERERDREKKSECVCNGNYVQYEVSLCGAALGDSELRSSTFSLCLLFEWQKLSASGFILLFRAWNSLQKRGFLQK